MTQLFPAHTFWYVKCIGTYRLVPYRRTYNRGKAANSHLNLQI